MYKVEGIQTTFFLNKKIAVLTSKSCPELAKDKLCSYLKFLNSIKIDKNKLSGGSINFGSIACKETLKKDVYLGSDAKGNDITFCKIDDYYLDLGTLDYYVSKNLGLNSSTRRRK
jgi:hypothetical protein